jgi:hypothetical protein
MVLSRHFRMRLAINSSHIVIELDGDAMGVVGIEGMDKSVVDSLGHPERCDFKPVFSSQSASSVSTPMEA